MHKDRDLEPELAGFEELSDSFAFFWDGQERLAQQNSADNLVLIAHGDWDAAEPERDDLLDRLCIDLRLQGKLSNFRDGGVDLSERHLVEGHRTSHHVDRGLVQTLYTLRHMVVTLLVVDVFFGMKVHQLNELFIVEAGDLVFALPPVEAFSHGPCDWRSYPHETQDDGAKCLSNLDL